MHMGYIFLGIASANILGAERRRRADVRPRPFHRAALCASPEKCADAPARWLLMISAVSARVMPFAGLRLWPWRVRRHRSARVSRISPRKSWSSSARFGTARKSHGFTFSKSPPSSRSGAWCISAVYMLRAYRGRFMGTIRERWQKLPDLCPALRVPVALLVAALLCCGFFRNFCANVAPTSGLFSPQLSMQTCPCAVRRACGRTRNASQRVAQRSATK